MQREQARGQVLRLQGREITPVAQVIRITWRGGSLEWHRPLAVEVRDDGIAQRIPIHNVTRRAVMSLALGGAALGVLAFWAEQVRRGRNSG